MSITSHNPVCPECQGWLEEKSVCLTTWPPKYENWLKCMSCGYMEKIKDDKKEKPKTEN